jgi:hypothetical protein
MITMSYDCDYCIIGGGIAGLYANYLLTKKKQKCIVLEKNSTVSGRVREHEFHGVFLKCGAGIVVPENKSLVKLLKKLGIKVVFAESSIKDLIVPAFDMGKAVKEVKKVYKKMTKKDLLTLTAREILYKYFEKDFADNFILHSEFGDYSESSFEYLMKYYPINDLDNQPFESMSGPWSALVDKLTLPNIETDYEVNTVEKKGTAFLINGEIQAKQVIFAVTISALENIKCIGFKLPNISDYVGSTPFSRVYAYYKDGYTIKDGYVKVGGMVDKVVKINKNVVMASYADGPKAVFWGGVKKLPLEDQKKIVKEKLEDVGFNFGNSDDIFIAYWTDGDHYIRPYGKYKTIDNLLDKLSKPLKNVYIIGEMLSKRPGYVDGALQSVERIFK